MLTGTETAILILARHSTLGRMMRRPQGPILAKTVARPALGRAQTVIMRIAGTEKNDRNSDTRHGKVNGWDNPAVTMAVRVLAAGATVLLCGLHTASAQDTGEITVEIGECIEIEAPVERLACFAAQVEQALTEESEAAQSENGATQDDAEAADDLAAEATPARQAETEPPTPATQPREEPASAAVASEQPSENAGRASSEPPIPAAVAEQPGESGRQAPEPQALASAGTDGEVDTEDLNWFERRRARRAARAAEREAEERAEAAEAAANQIVATITDLQERQPNAWLITLDNGQMWDQVRPQWYPLRPGQQVRLYPTNWGSSYRLTEMGRGGYIQVQRVR